MSLVLVGTSHLLAPVEDREQVAVDLEAAAELAAALADGGEAVCLSTCNRTELYLVRGDPQEAEGTLGWSAQVGFEAAADEMARAWRRGWK